MSEACRFCGEYHGPHCPELGECRLPEAYSSSAPPRLLTKEAARRIVDFLERDVAAPFVEDLNGLRCIASGATVVVAQHGAKP